MPFDDEIGRVAAAQLQSWGIIHVKVPTRTVVHTYTASKPPTKRTRHTTFRTVRGLVE